jgi:hypothetical protein
MKHPKTPTDREKQQLVDSLQGEGHGIEEATSLVKSVCIAVFDTYISTTPGYTGQIMTVAWESGPSYC